MVTPLKVRMVLSLFDVSAFHAKSKLSFKNLNTIIISPFLIHHKTIKKINYYLDKCAYFLNFARSEAFLRIYLCNKTYKQDVSIVSCSENALTQH